MKYFIPIIAGLFLSLSLQAQEIELKGGLHITQSCKVKKALYQWPASGRFEQNCLADSLQGLITIEGNNLIVDFQNAVLESGKDKERPDQFEGLAIRVTGKNITLKNARIRGYKVAMLAFDVEGLVLENCDFSYNYRPRLRSGREREDFSDWLSYHNNEHDEWLRYGAGIYLKNCTESTVKNCTITGNQNALLMVGCADALVYNNRFQFNSGLGIGLYRSSHNRIQHNRLDWNVRGYSEGFYQRGQDSAAILLYEQSSHNTVAYNSCTHSGDGIFLWAGQSTMDSGEGGCNDNLLFGNNCSYAPTNGIEVTFSRNTIQGNTIQECTYGIWGGYSFESLIMGNAIIGCKTAIAIEHGQDDTIRQNLLASDTTGIQLWARATQDPNWGYAQKRDVRSRDLHIDRNVFVGARKPLKINACSKVDVNGENLFAQFDHLLETSQPNEGFRFIRNEIYADSAQIERIWAHPALEAQRRLNFSKTGPLPDNLYYPLDIPYGELREPARLPDGKATELPTGQLYGRKYIIVNEWGPYDFRRPYVMLAPEHLPNGMYSMQMYGPPGQWQLVGMRGVEHISQVSGAFPETVNFTASKDSNEVWLQFKAVSDTPYTGQFGDTIWSSNAQPFVFDLTFFTKKLDWKVDFFNYDAASDPLLQPAAFAKMLEGAPLYSEQKSDLDYAWWDRPSAGIQADHFAVRASTMLDLAPGRYRVELCSDDGVRMYLDGEKVLDHWSVHEPAPDELELNLSGKHQLRIEYFEGGGFGTLDFRIKPLR